MRILHVYKIYFPDSYGGVERTINQLCLATTSLGITNRLLTLSQNPTPNIIKYPEVEVHRYQQNIEIASCSFSWKALTEFNSAVAWADVVHYHFPWPFADLLHILSRHKKPSVVTYHSDIVRQKYLLKLYEPLMQRFLQRVDAIVATSPNYLQSSPVLINWRNKTKVIPIGLDKASYPDVDLDRQARWQAQLGTNFFLFVGVLRYYKGLHILLEAIKGTNLQVVIVGSGPVEMELKNQAQQLGLNQVHFLGYVSDEDKVALYQLCRVVIFPSHLRSEAFGVSFLEGAMYGKPLISCEIGAGNSYININNETGYIVAPNEPAALKSAMLKLANDTELCTRMGHAASQRFLQLFTATKMAEQYQQLYANVTGIIHKEVEPAG